MFLAAKEFPLPIEYRFLPLEEVFHEPPADMADRTVDLPRLRQHRPHAGRLPQRRRQLRASTSTTTTTTPASATSTWSTSRPPARPRSSTSWRSCSAAEITPEIASALYVGLVTDTGKFMYENTNARTHRIAADADRGRGRRRRHLPPPLRARAAREAAPASRAPWTGSSATATGGSSSPTSPTADYEATGAGEEMTEGIIDHLRSVEGAKVAALIRDLGDRGRAARKVSLRSSDGEVDVSAIAREHGGGGHKRAAGFSTDLELERAGRASSAARSAPSSATERWRAEGEAGVLLCDKPAGITSHDVVAAVRRERGVQGRPRRHARPLRHRAAAGPARAGDAPAALPDRAAEDLPGDGPARLALEHRRPRRRADRDRARSRRRWSCRPARSASGCR